MSGRTGVWVGDRKLGAVGVAISGGFTRHGLAFNVSTNLESFSTIVPCGDPVRQATSLEQEMEMKMGERVELKEVAEVLAERAAMRLGFSDITWLPDVNELLVLQS